MTTFQHQLSCRTNTFIHFVVKHNLEVSVDKILLVNQSRSPGGSRWCAVFHRHSCGNQLLHCLVQFSAQTDLLHNTAMLSVAGSFSIRESHIINFENHQHSKPGCVESWTIYCAQVKVCPSQFQLCLPLCVYSRHFISSQCSLPPIQVLCWVESASLSISMVTRPGGKDSRSQTNSALLTEACSGDFKVSSTLSWKLRILLRHPFWIALWRAASSRFFFWIWAVCFLLCWTNRVRKETIHAIKNASRSQSVKLVNPSVVHNNTDTIEIPTDTEFTIEPEPSGTPTLDLPISRILIVKDASTYYGDRNGKEDKTEDERQEKLLLHPNPTAP